MAADQYQLSRLRRICEKRLCDTVDVETVATTLALAEQNHAEELKKVGGRGRRPTLATASWADHRCRACLGEPRHHLFTAILTCAVGKKMPIAWMHGVPPHFK